MEDRLRHGRRLGPRPLAGESLLYGVEAHDPATYLAVVATIVAVALAAALLPAVRAARVAPLEALRQE